MPAFQRLSSKRHVKSKETSACLPGVRRPAVRSHCGPALRFSKLLKSSSGNRVGANTKAINGCVERLGVRERRARATDLLSNKKLAWQIARMPRRGLNRWKCEEVNLSAEACSLLSRAKQGNSEEQIVVDSGTTMHVARDEEDFEHVSNTAVTIRGVGGGGRAFKGLLKASKLGSNIPAILFPSLPVRLLLSTSGLKQSGWETKFEMSGDKLSNVLCGTVLPIHTSSSGLPVLPDIFDDSEQCGFVCSPVGEVELDVMPAFNVESLPRGVRGALRESISSAQRAQRHKHRKKRISKLLEHRRMCHFHDSHNTTTCHDCLQMKGKHKGHCTQRPERYNTPTPLLVISLDFFGKIKPQSYRKNNFVLLYVCDCCSFAYGVPIKAKSDAPAELEKFVRQLRRRCGADELTGKHSDPSAPLIVGGVHTDNEPVLRSADWSRVCEKLGMQEMHSVPYNPEMNGRIERLVQTIKAALRTTMKDVDPRTWDFCLSHVINVWNMRSCRRTPKANCSCPDDVVNSISTSPLKRGTDVQAKKFYLRRYGCLTHFKPGVRKKDDHDDLGTALQPRRKRGIHLGFSDKSSCWLVGTWDKNTSSFSVYESRSCVFCEDILVADVRELDSHATDPLEQLIERAAVDLGTGESVGSAKADVGLGALSGGQGLCEIQWESGDGDETGVSSDAGRCVASSRLTDEAEDNVPVATQDSDPGKSPAPPETSILV